MASPDLIIRGRNVVLPDSIGAQSIYIRDGVIESVRDYEEIAGDCELVEADDNSVIMPGLVDTHVHVNAPGRTDWEGFQHATAAAAAGGTTTLDRHAAQFDSGDDDTRGVPNQA